MAIVADWKHCPSCGWLKPACAFWKVKGARTGLGGRCRDCRVAPPTHPPGTKFCRVCWIRKPFAEFVSSSRYLTGTASRCMECNRAYQAAWAEKHREQVRQKNREWTAANLAYYRAYRASHKEERQRINAQWRERHPLVVQAGTERYRARKLANGGEFTSAEWVALCAAQGQRCLCCGQVGTLTMDHIVPISAGGRHEASNIQGLCRACNLRKGARTIDYR